MIPKVITSILMWMVYLVTATSIILVFYFLFKILVWDSIKKRFKKEDKEVLEKDPSGE